MDGERVFCVDADHVVEWGVHGGVCEAEHGKCFRRDFGVLPGGNGLVDGDAEGKGSLARGVWAVPGRIRGRDWGLAVWQGSSDERDRIEGWISRRDVFCVRVFVFVVWRVGLEDVRARRSCRRGAYRAA